MRIANPDSPARHLDRTGGMQFVQLPVHLRTAGAEHVGKHALAQPGGPSCCLLKRSPMKAEQKAGQLDVQRMQDDVLGEVDRVSDGLAQYTVGIENQGLSGDRIQLRCSDDIEHAGGFVSHDIDTFGLPLGHRAQRRYVAATQQRQDQFPPITRTEAEADGPAQDQRNVLALLVAHEDHLVGLESTEGRMQGKTPMGVRIESCSRLPETFRKADAASMCDFQGHAMLKRTPLAHEAQLLSREY